MSFSCPANIIHDKNVYNAMKDACNRNISAPGMNPDNAYCENIINRLVQNGDAGGLADFRKYVNQADSSTLVGMLKAMACRMTACTTAFELDFGANLLKGTEGLINRNAFTKFIYLLSYLVVIYLGVKYVYLKLIRGDQINGKFVPLGKQLYGSNAGNVGFMIIMFMTVIGTTISMLQGQTWLSLYSFAGMAGVVAGCALLGVILFLAESNYSLSDNILPALVFAISIAAGLSIYRLAKSSSHVLIGLIITCLISICITYLLDPTITGNRLANAIILGIIILGFTYSVYGYAKMNDVISEGDDLVDSEAPFIKKEVNNQIKNIGILFGILMVILMIGMWGFEIFKRYKLNELINQGVQGARTQIQQKYGRINRIFLIILTTFVLIVMYTFNLSMAVVAPYLLLTLIILEKLITMGLSGWDAMPAGIITPEQINSWMPFGSILLQFIPGIGGHRKVFGEPNQNMFTTN